MADRVRRRAADDAAAQISWAFRLSLSREPAPAELATCRQFLVDQAADAAGNDSLRDLCQMLLCTNEFLYVP